MSPTQKVVLISGASSGIGRATAVLLAQRGFRVFGTSRNPASVEAAAGIDFLPLDVRSDESVKACFDVVLARAGRLDALINNAGYVLEGAVEEVSVEEAKAQFETNVFGPMRTIKAALPVMRAQASGTIINISSLAGLVAAPPFWGIYSASKYALEGYTEHLWREVRPFKIRVALVEPGSIRTDLSVNRKAAAQLQHYAAWRERAIAAARRMEVEGPAPELVAQTVLSILEADEPRLRYRVGRQSIWIARLRRFLPTSVFERNLRKGFGLESME